ncbi:MAG TPA: tRNA dihydrouridine synthase DusB [Candidatus Binatia bacterium]|jgi:nifR3 family TIM-barrel protein
MSADRDLLRPLAIGPIRTRTNLVLSPMSGVTDCAFRTTVLEAGGRDAVGLLVSEFIAAEGLSRDNPKTVAMLRYAENERPFSIQIFGADADRMVRAAEMVEEAGADIVDINCGCPAPKVVKRGGGAQLMRTPDVLQGILRAVRAAVSIPVTVKIRAGWDDNSRNAVDFAKMVEDEGAAMLAIHGRTRLQLYSGEADWDLVGEVASRLSIPVLGSGDIADPDGALARLRGGYSDGVMIGRGAMTNPWIFGQTLALAQGRPAAGPTAAERLAVLSHFAAALQETKDLRSWIGRLRGLACHMCKGLPGGAATRRVLGRATSAAAVERILREFLLEGRRFDFEIADDEAPARCVDGPAYGADEPAYSAVSPQGPDPDEARSDDGFDAVAQVA